MTRLPIITGAQLVRLLERAGFTVSRTQGSHYVMRHADGRRTAVPVHSGRDIALPLLKKILRQVELDAEEYARLAREL